MLATTKSYLMVVKTTYKDPKTGKECCGFTSRMGANAPAPRLLRLKPQDVALTVGGQAGGRRRWAGLVGRRGARAVGRHGPRSAGSGPAALLAWGRSKSGS